VPEQSRRPGGICCSSRPPVWAVPCTTTPAVLQPRDRVSGRALTRARPRPGALSTAGGTDRRAGPGQAPQSRTRSRRPARDARRFPARGAGSTTPHARSGACAAREQMPWQAGSPRRALERARGGRWNGPAPGCWPARTGLPQRSQPHPGRPRAPWAGLGGRPDRAGAHIRAGRVLTASPAHARPAGSPGVPCFVKTEAGWRGCDHGTG
jgi:hypothetical protein